MQQARQRSGAKAFAPLLQFHGVRDPESVGDVVEEGLLAPYDVITRTGQVRNGWRAMVTLRAVRVFDLGCYWFEMAF